MHQTLLSSLLRKVKWVIVAWRNKRPPTFFPLHGSHRCLHASEWGWEAVWMWDHSEHLVRGFFYAPPQKWCHRKCWVPKKPCSLIPRKFVTSATCKYIISLLVVHKYFGIHGWKRIQWDKYCLLNIAWRKVKYFQTFQYIRDMRKVRKTQHQNPEFGHKPGEIEKKPTKKCTRVQGAGERNSENHQFWKETEFYLVFPFFSSWAPSLLLHIFSLTCTHPIISFESLCIKCWVSILICL